MPTDKRRADARRRAWGRGPMILRFEPLENRELLSTAAVAAAATTPAAAPKPDLAGQSFITPANLNWGASFQAQAVVVNQGDAPTAKPFLVDIYASPTPAVGPNSVLIGEQTVPAGLMPNATARINPQLTLPATPLNGLSPSGSFYVSMVVDPKGAVDESNTHNNADTGAGFDYTLVTPPLVQSAALVGTGLSISPGQTDWGGTFTLSQQISNTGNGDALPTRVVVLTPSGASPGGPYDFSLGSINIPAIAAGHYATIAPTIVLPQAPPPSFNGVTQYTLSVIQDADYVTNAMYPHAATQGNGQDRVPLTITTPGYANSVASAQPALSVSGVAVDSANVKWGQSLQVAATLANSGNTDPGPFRVRFLLVGGDGTLSNALFLTDTTVGGLAAGGTQNIVTTVKLPSTLPGGASLNSQGLARIAVVVDPESALGQSRSNTEAVSSLLQLQVVGTNGEVTPAATIMKPLTSTTTTTAKSTTTATNPAKIATKTGTAVTPKPAAFPKPKVLAKPVNHSLQHNLKVFPSRVSKFFKSTFKF